MTYICKCPLICRHDHLLILRPLLEAQHKESPQALDLLTWLAYFPIIYGKEPGRPIATGAGVRLVSV